MGWSAWQDPWAMPFSVPRSSYLVGSQHASQTVAYTSGGDADPLADLPTADAQAGTQAADVSPVFFVLYDLIVQKILSATLSAQVIFGYDSVTLLGSAFADQISATLPPTLPANAGVIPVAMYETGKPVAGGKVQYESTSTTFATWDDAVYPARSLDCPPSPNLPATLPFVVGNATPISVQRSYPTQPPADDGVQFYQGFPTVYSDLNALTILDAPTDGTPFDVNVALSAAGTADMSLVVVSRLYDPFSPIDRPHIHTDTVPAVVDEVQAKFKGPGLIWGGTSTFPAFGVVTPVIRYTSARWRYWTGDWHTAGGHWTDPGGAQLRILTPGDGPPTWVPVVDGPAA